MTIRLDPEAWRAGFAAGEAGEYSLLGAATLDPERLLWVPGKKLISIPKPQTLALRFTQFYDDIADLWISRVDILCGTGLFEPNLGLQFGPVHRDLSPRRSIELVKEHFPLDWRAHEAAETLVRNALDHGGTHAMQTVRCPQVGRIIGRAFESPVIPSLK